MLIEGTGCGVLLGNGCGETLPPMDAIYVCDEMRGGIMCEKYSVSPSVCPNCGKVSEFIWVWYVQQSVHPTAFGEHIKAKWVLHG